MTHINQLTIRIPVVDIVHIPGTIQAILDQNLPEHINLEIFVPENFPQSTTVTPEDQKALDDRLAQTKAILDQVKGIVTTPPGS